MHCQDSDELLTLNRQFDRRVVNWHGLGCSGLRARSVGGSRVCIRRVSPGCGVHRRKKHGVRCAERIATCAQSGLGPRQDECGSSARSVPVCVQVEECGSRWRGRKAKCLQACVASLFHGSLRDRVQRRLSKQCSNHAGSGYGGGRVEGRNLEAVQRLLEDERVYVYVVESTCVSSLVRGSIDGVWRLGAMRGSCVGSLAWLSESCHVVKVTGAESLVSKCTSPLAKTAPWARFIVGAPKKTKRGANLQRGGSGYVARLGGKMAQASQGSDLGDGAGGAASVAAALVSSEPISVVGTVQGVSLMASQELPASAAAEVCPASNPAGGAGGEHSGSGYVARLGGKTGQASQSSGLRDRVEEAAQGAVSSVVSEESVSAVGLSADSGSSMPARVLCVVGSDEARTASSIVSGVGLLHQSDHTQELGHPPDVTQLCTVVRSRDCSPAGSASSSSGISFGVRNDRCEEPPPCGWLSASSG